MKAVILAGGVGTRLRPLTENRPKPLIPVAGKPCIDFIINSLVAAGFDKTIITTGYLSDKLIQQIGEGTKYSASILYSFEENPAGTAGAVKRVSSFLDKTFIVASGDVLVDVNIKKIYDFHKQKKAMATMALTTVENPTEFGIVEIDEDGRIKRFKEKPAKEEVFSNLINAGIYILEPEVLKYIPEGEKFDFSKQVFPALLEAGAPLYGIPLDGIWHDIGRPADLLSASLSIIKKMEAKNDLPDVKIEGNVAIGKNTSIEKDVEIIGPAFIGDNVYISQGTVIDKSCIYDGVFIDRGLKLENSIIMENSKIGWKTHIIDSVVSNNCNIEDDVLLKNSMIGDNMTVKIHSKLTDANISPPSVKNGQQSA